MKSFFQSRIVSVALLLFIIVQASAFSGPAITHQVTSSRFGDNLLSYMHAKWISYLYDIPLLYQPFPQSTQLELHGKELRLDQYKKFFKNQVFLDSTRPLCIDKKSRTLYTLAYAPESTYEVVYDSWTDKPWAYIPINWDDVEFKKQLVSLIKPCNILKNTIQLPSDRISVAMHVRRGGSFENFDSTRKIWPLKFPTYDYYVQALRYIDFLVGHRNLLVYVFTDEKLPANIMNEFKKIFAELSNISFMCNQGECNGNIGVLDDFFAFTRFDCIVMPYSNFSLCASKLGDYAIKILPKTGYFIKDTFLITDLDVAINVERMRKVLACGQAG